MELTQEQRTEIEQRVAGLEIQHRQYIEAANRQLAEMEARQRQFADGANVQSGAYIGQIAMLRGFLGEPKENNGSNEATKAEDQSSAAQVGEVAPAVEQHAETQAQASGATILTN